MKSIIHSKDGTCYLCMKFDNNLRASTPLQEHHVMFGTSNRKLSEKYGLKVYLCVGHHLASGYPNAVHRSKETREYLCKEAQKCFEKHYPSLSFLEIFGKNYLDDTDRNVENINWQQSNIGFIPISEGLDSIDW